jgi:hypothetical protein
MKRSIPLLIALVGVALIGIVGGVLGSRFLFSSEGKADAEGLSPSQVEENDGRHAAEPAVAKVRREEIETDRFDLAETVSEEPEPEPEPAAEVRRHEVSAEVLRSRAEEMKTEIHRRSTDIANRLSLATGSELRIAEIFLEELDRVEVVREEYRARGGGPDSRKEFREQLGEVRKWRNGELDRVFGVEVAGRIRGIEDRGEEG